MHLDHNTTTSTISLGEFALNAPSKRQAKWRNWCVRAQDKRIIEWFHVFARTLEEQWRAIIESPVRGIIIGRDLFATLLENLHGNDRA